MKWLKAITEWTAGLLLIVGMLGSLAIMALLMIPLLLVAAIAYGASVSYDWVTGERKV